MIFLNPTYLLALLGLAVPVAIHLWSKKEGKTIRIGSIQLLRESDPKQTSSIKLNELWLLLLRMLMIAVLVLIMAEPRLTKEGKNTALTYIIEPSLLSYDKVYSLIDTIDTETPVKLRLLQAGLPEYEQGEPEENELMTPNYWQLAREMEELRTDSVVVFTNAYRKGVKGKRPKIEKNINWVILDPGEPAEGLVEANRKGNELELISVMGDHQNLSFGKELVPGNSDRLSVNEQGDSISISGYGNEEWLELKTADSLNVLIRYDEGFSAEMRYISSSFRAVSEYLNRPVNIRTTQNADSTGGEDFSAIVWLSEEPVLQAETPLLISRPDSLSGSIVEPGSREKVFHLTSALDSENVIEEHLPEKLLMMLDRHLGIEEKIREYDRRVMSKGELLPVTSAVEKGREFKENLDITHWLWLLLGVSLIAERILSSYRKQ